MFQGTIRLNPTSIVAALVLVAALVFAFASEIGAQSTGQHCVSQASPLQAGTASQEPTTLACFETVEEAWNWAGK
jgi:hypothetical protein